MDESPVEALTAAVQAFVNDTEGHAAIVTSAVLVFEVARYDDDGDQLRRISYSIPDVAGSLSASLGLLDAGLHLVRRDALGDGSDDDD